MLYQLHQQNIKNGKSIMISQRENINSTDIPVWVAETKKKHPLPEGYSWVIHNENSEYFWKTQQEKE